MSREEMRGEKGALRQLQSEIDYFDKIDDIERSTPVEMWDDFDDQEVSRLLEMEEGTPL